MMVPAPYVSLFPEFNGNLASKRTQLEPHYRTWTSIIILLKMQIRQRRTNHVVSQLTEIDRNNRKEKISFVGFTPLW